MGYIKLLLNELNYLAKIVNIFNGINGAFYTHKHTQNTISNTDIIHTHKHN